MLTALVIVAVGLSLAAAMITIQIARALAAGQAQAVRVSEQTRTELLRVREKRHTHQTIAMIEDLSAVGCDLAIELESFATRQANLLGRGASASAQACLAEFVTYARARLNTQILIIGRGRRGPFSYRPVNTHARPARPGSTSRG
jgi:hypothetical protein